MAVRNSTEGTGHGNGHQLNNRGTGRTEAPEGFRGWVRKVVYLPFSSPQNGLQAVAQAPHSSSWCSLSGVRHDGLSAPHAKEQRAS